MDKKAKKGLFEKGSALKTGYVEKRGHSELRELKQTSLINNGLRVAPSQVKGEPPPPFCPMGINGKSHYDTGLENQVTHLLPFAQV